MSATELLSKLIPLNARTDCFLGAVNDIEQASQRLRTIGRPMDEMIDVESLFPFRGGARKVRFSNSVWKDETRSDDPIRGAIGRRGRTRVTNDQNVEVN